GCAPSVTWFALEPLWRRHPRLGVIHFDAHHDLYPSGRGRPLSHINPFVFALEQESLAVLYQVGLHTIESVPLGHEPVADPRIRYISAYELRGRAPSRVFAGLPDDIPYYLTFDVDCLPVHIAPETGMPSLAGIDYHQCLDLIEYAARRFQFIGADFVEVSTGHNHVNLAARATAAVLLRFLLGHLRYRALETYF